MWDVGQIQILPHPLHSLQIPERKGTTISPGKQDRLFRQRPQRIYRIILGTIVPLLIIGTVIYHYLKSWNQQEKQHQQHNMQRTILFGTLRRRNPGQAQ